MVASSQANIGTEPALTFGARNIFTDFGVPRPKDRDTDEIYRSARDLQMITRTRRLGINESSATEAWKQSGATFTRAQHFTERPAATAAVVFHGSDSAGLNALIARRDVKAIRLSSPHLDLTGPLIVRRNDLEIDLGEAHIRLNGPAPFMIRIEAASNIRLHGGVFDSGPGAIVIQHSRAVLVANAQITGIHGGGVLVTDSRECVVWRNQFHRVGGAPVMQYMSYLRESHNQVEEVYELDKAGAFTGPGTGEGRALVDRQLAAAATELRDLIYTAWVRSSEPLPERQTSKTH